eukprot:COSAG06_NODE_35537_length_459_cov_0.458333_1_plen_69_part_10
MIKPRETVGSGGASLLDQDTQSLAQEKFCFSNCKETFLKKGLPGKKNKKLGMGSKAPRSKTQQGSNGGY